MHYYILYKYCYKMIAQKSKRATNTVKEYIVKIQGLKLFNSLPAVVRNIMNQPVENSRIQDKYCIADLPGNAGLQAATSSSLADQPNNKAALPQAGLWG